MGKHARAGVLFLAVCATTCAHPARVTQSGAGASDSPTFSYTPVPIPSNAIRLDFPTPIQLDHDGPYTFSLPPIAGLTSSQVESAGVGKVITGGDAAISDVLVTESDSPEGLVFGVRFSVSSRTGDPYLNLINGVATLSPS